jgi:hypothetical protein
MEKFVVSPSTRTPFAICTRCWKAAINRSKGSRVIANGASDALSPTAVRASRPPSSRRFVKKIVYRHRRTLGSPGGRPRETGPSPEGRSTIPGRGSVLTSHEPEVRLVLYFVTTDIGGLRHAWMAANAAARCSSAEAPLLRGSATPPTARPDTPWPHPWHCTQQCPEAHIALGITWGGLVGGRGHRPPEGPIARARQPIRAPN